MVSSPHVDKLNNLIYICEAGLLPRLFFPSWCQIRKHACTRQPHYMLFGCLMRAGRKMENVPSVVCLMVGFLELSSYRRIARMEQTAPICWPLQGKNTVFQLASSSCLFTLSAAKHSSRGPSKLCTQTTAHCQMPKCRSLLFIFFLFVFCNQGKTQNEPVQQARIILCCYLITFYVMISSLLLCFFPFL